MCPEQSYKACGSIQRDEDGGGFCIRDAGHTGRCSDGQSNWITEDTLPDCSDCRGVGFWTDADGVEYPESAKWTRCPCGAAGPEEAFPDTPCGEARECDLPNCCRNTVQQEVLGSRTTFPEQKCDAHHDTGQPCYGCYEEGAKAERDRIHDLIADRHAYHTSRSRDTSLDWGDRGDARLRAVECLDLLATIVGTRS